MQVLSALKKYSHKVGFLKTDTIHLMKVPNVFLQSARQMLGPVLNWCYSRSSKRPGNGSSAALCNRRLGQRLPASHSELVSPFPRSGKQIGRKWNWQDLWGGLWCFLSPFVTVSPLPELRLVSGVVGQIFSWAGISFGCCGSTKTSFWFSCTEKKKSIAMGHRDLNPP